MTTRDIQSVPVPDHVRELFLLRNVIIAGELGALVVPHAVLGVALSPLPFALGIGCQALLNLITWRRARAGRRISEIELCAQLLADIALLSALFYRAGGITNPFVDLYFVSVAFAAAVLHWRYALTVAVGAALAHMILGIYTVPLNMPSGGEGLDWWLVSIRISDFLTATMVAYVMFKVASGLRRNQQLLAQAREKELDNRRLVELGAMAAGAAHELGTPLATLAVLTRELRHSYPKVQKLGDDLRIMEGQIEACKGTLNNMLAAAGRTRVEGGGQVRFDRFMDGVMQRWRLLRPGVTASMNCSGSGAVPEIVADLTLEHAIVNLLDNAADASPQEVTVTADWNAECLHIQICDRGTGVPPAAANRIGRPFFTTKQHDQGKGLGLFLTVSTIERLGGSFGLKNRSDGGACAEVMLPLDRLTIAGGGGHGPAA